MRPHPALPRRLAAVLLLSISLSWCLSALATDLTVSAAASLTNALHELAPRFESEHPDTHVLLNFAASDALLAQIAKGAPVDLFASADQDTMDRAASQQLIDPVSRQNFVRNSLVLITPLVGGLALKSLADLLRPDVQRIALGRPEAVPAGRYARAALQAAGVWPALEARTVPAQNVRQALDYVARGEVDAGFVYATDAAQMKDRVQVACAVDTRTPITYPVAVVAGSRHAALAQQFVTFLRSPASQATLARFGFQKP